jgi:hypothetical protein
MEQNFLQMVNAEQSLTKTRAAEFAEMIIEINENGHVDTFTALARLEFMSQVIDNAKSKLRQSATDELDLYGPEAKTGIKRFGVTFKSKETAVKYDFSMTPIWNDLKAAEDHASDQRKDLEAQLKALKKSTVNVDPETGEMVEMVVPIKSSKTTVEITLSK